MRPFGFFGKITAGSLGHVTISAGLQRDKASVRTACEKLTYFSQASNARNLALGCEAETRCEQEAVTDGSPRHEQDVAPTT
jgi:hypothetical protein